jgi:hypothetical protein
MFQKVNFLLTIDKVFAVVTNTYKYVRISYVFNFKKKINYYDGKTRE